MDGSDDKYQPAPDLANSALNAVETAMADLRR